MVKTPSPGLAHGIELAGRIPGLQKLLRWWARHYRNGSVVKIRSGYARGMRWRRDHRYVNGYWLGHYELPVQKAVAERLEEGDVFYDVGANAGFFSLIAASRVGRSGLCVAFDPDPDNWRTMNELVRLNALHNWTAVAEAVGGARGCGRFRRSSAGASTNRLVAPGAGESPVAEELEVRVTTLDHAAERWRPPRFVKVDVEGAEIEVLRGARRVLREARPTWLIELHGEDQAHAVHRLMSAADYRLLTLDGARVLTPGEPVHHLLARPEEAR